MGQKVAYVTGGMGGIGTAVCQRLHKDGFKVIAGCGPSRDFQKWLDEQKALGFTFYASVGNVGDWDSTVEAFEKAKAEHGSIDVLVNNAGITRDRMFVKMSPEDWRAVIETNPDALAIAAQLDAELRAGTVRSPLHGLPVVVKDVFATADQMKTANGSLALAENTVVEDGFLITLLRNAGAIVLGKANMSEWAGFRSSGLASGWSGRGGQRNTWTEDSDPEREERCGTIWLREDRQCEFHDRLLAGQRNVQSAVGRNKPETQRLTKPHGGFVQMQKPLNWMG